MRNTSSVNGLARFFAALGFGLAVVSSSTALAQSPLEVARDAYRAAVAAAPLTVVTSLLVENPASGFGDYSPREGNIFAAGEPIHVYLELTGYDLRVVDGQFETLFQVDARLVTEGGTTIWGRANLQEFGTTLRSETLESFRTLTYAFDGLPAGGYTIVTTLRDAFGGDDAVIETPVVIE